MRRVEVHPAARAALTALASKAIRGRRTIAGALAGALRALERDEVADHPGHALRHELVGLRRLHVAARYRLVYAVRGDLVVVLFAGLRVEGRSHDVYAETRTRLEAGDFEEALRTGR